MIEHYLKLAHKADGVLTEICCSDTVAGALNQLASRDFDIVLLDLFLKDGYGVESLNRIIPAAQKTPIIVLSSLAGEISIVDTCLSMGAADALDKNHINEHVLIRTIIKVMMRFENTILKQSQVTDKIRRTVSELNDLRTQIKKA